MANQFARVWDAHPRLKGEQGRLSRASAWELESKATHDAAEGFTNGNGSRFVVFTRLTKRNQVGRAQERRGFLWNRTIERGTKKRVEGEEKGWGGPGFPTKEGL